MDWQPATTPAVLETRARLLATARKFFAARGVLEVQTPVLVSSSCPDPAIPSIAAQPRDGRRMFLHTSPEHAMKRILCAGSRDIYQVCPVFRDGEAGRWHNPEFTLIEWYRQGIDERALAIETVALIAALLQLDIQPVAVSYGEAFMQALDLDPHTASIDQLTSVCAANNIALPTDAGRDALLDLLLSTVVAPGFAVDTCYILYDYPASQAALARIRDESPPVAARFEIFYGALELANGFHELADPLEQRQRFLAEQQRHEETGVAAPPLDEHLLTALGHGLPDCAGVALGFDRVAMLACGATALSSVLPFPADRV